MKIIMGSIIGGFVSGMIGAAISVAIMNKKNKETNNRIDNKTFKIANVTLSNLTEYEDYKLLDQIMLGDVVNVIDENLQTSAVCVKTIYDSSMNKYSTIEIDKMDNVNNNVNNVVNETT